MWQGREVEGPPEPLQPPSPEVLSKSHVKMPSTAFEARYDSQDLPNGFKVEDDQGRIRVVSNFRQGFTGRAVERYPSGETYTGDFVDARRHGRGQFMDADGDGLMVSHFKKGRPVGEGTKFHQPWTNPSATRTFDGKEGASIPMKEASKIIKNLKTTSTIPVPVAQGFSAAVRAAKASTPPPKPKHRHTPRGSDASINYTPCHHDPRVRASALAQWSTPPRAASAARDGETRARRTVNTSVACGHDLGTTQ